MGLNYLKIAFRNLRRHAAYETINVAGLAVGFACFLLIALYVAHEASYDAFHPEADRLYRVVQREPGEDAAIATTPKPLLEVLQRDYPHLAEAASIAQGEYAVRVDDRVAREVIHFASPAFLDLFAFPLLRGRPVRDAPDEILVTEAFARRHFGDADPVGRVVTVRGAYDFVVAGVLAPIPSHSSLRFDVLASQRALERLEGDEAGAWWSSGHQTFVRVADGAAAGALARELPAVVARHVPDWLRARVQFELQPVRRMHLEPGVRDRYAAAVAPRDLYALGGIALGILLIACINFVNLSTARQAQRVREIGVRKVLGASRGDLYLQFVGESVLLTAAGAVVGLGLAQLLLPVMGALTGVALALPAYRVIVPALLAGSGLVGVLAGSYPALLLAARHPVDSLAGARGRGQRSLAPRGLTLRRILVVGQFAVSICLISGTVVIGRQVRYMQTRDLGFAPDDVVAVDLQPDLVADGADRLDAYVRALEGRQADGLRSVSRSEHVPGNGYTNTFGLAVPGAEVPPAVSVTSVDTAFFDTYRMRLREGRPFSAAHATDAGEAVLVNEAFVRLRGWGSAVGQEVAFAHGEGPYRVIGVVADFNFESLRHAIAPQVYRAVDGSPWRRRYVSVRIDPEARERALARLEAEWKRLVPGVPFRYAFVRDRLDASYEAERRAARVVGSFTAVAVVLACLGVLGLASLAVAQRTKEFGIRKVLGASGTGIVFLLAREFAGLVLIAGLLAAPVAYVALQGWLDGYAYRVALGPGVFVASGGVALVAALAAAGWQAVRAARANPVVALRAE